MQSFRNILLYFLTCLSFSPDVCGICVDQGQFTAECSQPFQTWQSGGTFWSDICSPEGRAVFSCLHGHYGDNCTVYNPDDYDTFTSLFRPVNYSIDFACEYNLKSVCREIPACFDSITNYTSNGVYPFYEYLCGNAYLQYVFGCMESKEQECPVITENLSGSLNVMTTTLIITYGEIQLKTELECPKLNASDVTCLASYESQITSQCQVSPVIDMINYQLQCGYTGQTLTCISSLCGPTVAAFFEAMFTFLQCNSRIDGGLSEWSEWSECAETCGSGLDFRSRTRTCTNPPPSGGGLDCTGMLIDLDDCDTVECPVDGGFGFWNLWSPCSSKCGEGVQTRSRQCNNPVPAYGGQDCVGERSQAQPCQQAPCPINGGFSAWSAWSTCSVTCGTGSQTSTRSCDNPAPAYGGSDCIGTRSETTSCSSQQCPVDGVYSTWSVWTACTVLCGGGTQNRTRTCTNPAPAYGGSNCSGSSLESLNCNTQECIKTTCPEVTDTYGLWPNSTVGQTASIPCDNKYHVGNYSRACVFNGVWDVVINFCQLNESLLQDLSTEVKHLLNTTATITEEVLNILSQNLTELAANMNYDIDGDLLDNVLDILKDITDVIRKAGNITDKTFKNLVDSVSNIIQPKSVEAWSKNTGTVLGSEVLGTVDSLISVVLKIRCQTIGGIKTLDTKNIYSEIGAVTGDIIFPNSKVAGASIEIPTAALPNKGVTDTRCFGGSHYSSVANIIEEVSTTGRFEEVGSDVIGIQLQGVSGAALTDLVPPVRIALTIKKATFENVTCVYWDFSKTNVSRNGAWSSEGCVLVSVVNNTAFCECSHLTNFAILMSPFKTSDGHTKALSIISAIGCAISIVCLILTLVAHYILWRLVRSAHVIVLMNLCVALLFALIIFLAGVNRTENREACIAIAALIQVLFLAVFAFMFLLGLEILISVVHVFFTKYPIKILIPLAWIIPVVIVGVSLGVTKTSGYGNDQFCWLDVKSGVIWSFVGPVAFVIAVNFVVIVIVFRKMSSSTILKNKTKASQTKTIVRSLCVLLPVLGLTWVFGVLSVNTDAVAVQYLFCIVNSLQGLVIFLFHCVFNTQIRTAVKRRRDRRRSLETFSSDLRKQSRSKSLSQSQDGQPNSLSESSNQKRKKPNIDYIKKSGNDMTIHDWEKEQRRKYHRNLRLSALSPNI